jgi:hypothetical protein
MLLDPSPEKVALRRRQLEALLTPQEGTFKLDPASDSRNGGRPPDDPLPCPLATDPQSPDDHEQSSTLNKKQRTIAEVILMPTERQKTCPHPPEHIVILPDNITICNHCYGLLDENFKLVTEEKPVENVRAA